MAKSQSGKALTLQQCTRLNSEAEDQENVTVFTATVNGREYICTMTPTDALPSDPTRKPTMGKPWSRIGQLMQWKRINATIFGTKQKATVSVPGSAAMNTESGDYAGYRVQVEVSKYFPQYDNREKKTTVASTVVDDLPF